MAQNSIGFVMSYAWGRSMEKLADIQKVHVVAYAAFCFRVHLYHIFV